MAIVHQEHHKNTGSLPNTDMAILEDPMEWLKSFHQGFLSHFEHTGELDWDKYVRPRNNLAPSGHGINLTNSRLLLISTAGGYVVDEQEPFDELNPLGDYSLRLIPTDTPIENINFAHNHKEFQYVEQDPQVLLPLGHLKDMEREGRIGEIAPVVVSFHGYQPNVIRVARELSPAILRIAQEFSVDAALLVPALPLCIQSVGLISRALEVNGIATTLTSWSAELTEATAPPRATITKLNQGSTLSMPGDAAQQRRVLEATLNLLALDAPVKLVHLNETAK